MVKRVIGTTNVRTGEFVPAPSHCVECGALVHVVRRIVGTMYECACEECDVTFVVSMRDSQTLPPAPVDKPTITPVPELKIKGYND